MARTIQTCRFAFAALLMGQSAQMEARITDRSALSSYMQARVADAAGNSDVATQAYASALTASGGNTLVALRTYREAVEGGSRALAIRAVRQLQQSNALPADARLLLFIDALERADWKAARLSLDRMEEAGGYDFLVPILRAWVTLAARDGDPVALLDAVPKGGLTAAYAGEHRALILLNLGRKAEGLAAVQALGGLDARSIPARLSAASRLASQRDLPAAIALVQGDEAALQKARALLAAKRSLQMDVDGPGQGTAVLLSRVAEDLMRDRVSPVALTLSRMARFADARNDHVALVEAQALDANRKDDAALAAFRALPAGSLFASDAGDGQVIVLQRQGRTDEAVALAKASIARPSAALIDHVRLGEIYARAERQTEAAAAFNAGVAFARGADGKGKVPWGLWLLYGGALERSGEWEKAREALKQAVALAPDQAAALNHLGYAMLERRENMVEATRLIERASKLRPDDAAITDSLGWAYFLNGRTILAVETLERAVSIDGIEPTLSEHLGDAYWVSGRRVDARYSWSAARSNSEDEKAVKRLSQKIDLGLTAETAAR